MSTTAKERYEVINRLQKLGIDYDTAQQLRRISLTLQRWFEMECGTEGPLGQTISIEREGGTDDGKPFKRIQWQSSSQGWQDYRYPIADMEKGALARLRSIMKPLKGLVPYVQGDCRGASLYILRKSDLKPGDNIDSVYTRGVAIY